MATDILSGDDDVAGMREGSRHGRVVLPDLPVPATSFVDREEEIASLVASLADPATRLLTVTGPGGIGKTRLAIEIARRCGEKRDIAFVPLDTTTLPERIPEAIVQRLGIELGRDEPSLETLYRVLGNDSLLLVLDNFEHLLTGASFVDTLLDMCRNLTILATSRIALGIPGEIVVPLRPLAVPDSIRSLTENEPAGAVRLFLDRARSVQPALMIGSHNLADVVKIVQRLEGIPLAIELAAARTRLLSPHSLAERLDQRLPILTGGSLDSPSRQQTMRAAIAWSVDLLPRGLRRLWELLGTFSGGFTVDAAEAVAEACGMAGSAVMDGVQALVEQSLLVALTNAEGEPRFAMLETTREYALECLDARDATGAARAAHAAFFHAFAREVEPGLKGPDGWTWFRRVDADLPNIRLALGWFREQGDIEAALEVAACLEWFWTAPGFLSEGRALYETLLPLAGSDVSARIRGKAWSALGDLVEWQGVPVRAAEAQHHALAAAREAGDQTLIAGILRSLGSVMIDLGRLDEAGAMLLEAYSLARESGDLWTTAASANLTGLVSRLQGDLALARTWHETALTIWQQMGNRDHVPIALVGLGQVWIDSHDDQRALETLDAALSFTTDDEDDYDTSTALDGIASIAARHGQHAVAASLMGAAARHRSALGTPLRPALKEEIGHVVAAVRAALESASFAVAWAEGQALDVADVKRLARAVTLSEPSPPDGLSTREREVLSLLVEGASDNEIADRLFITRRTASKHVASILEKLDAGNRTAAATIAHRRGLV